MLSRWLREPLLHFVVLGVGVFAVHRWVAAPPAQRIVLSRTVLDGLRQEHVRRTGSAPSPEDEAALIRHYVDTEILYREALAQGLDRGDVIVRRRLVQKMEFVLEGLEPIPEPTDAELEAHRDAHAERYAVPARVALTHVFVAADRHGADAERMASTLRERLLAGAEPQRLGDPFLHGQQIAQRTERELAGIFGAPFATAVQRVAVGEWVGPLRSAYGLHLVRVDGRTEGRTPPLNEIRETLAQDWREERRADANRVAIERVRQGYEIVFEPDRRTALASELPQAGSAEGVP
jgi:hypothetical protein